MGAHNGGHGGPFAPAVIAAAAAAAAASAGTQISNSTHWSTEETKLLIRTWGDHRDEFAEIKRNLTVWNKVLERLLNAGFYRTVEQCRNRWKFLETKYKTAARDIDTAGCTSWEFFDDMDLAKHGTTHRRNSSSSSAGMYRHIYESPSQSPSQQNSILSVPSSQKPGAQAQHSTALHADSYGRVMLPPIRPAAAAPQMASTDSAHSMRHGSPAPPVTSSSSQHSRLYQPRQDSPSAHFAYHHHNQPSSSSNYPTHMQTQYYETVATSSPPPPPTRRLSPLLQQQQQQQRSPQLQQLRQQARLHRPSAGRGPTSQTQQQPNLRHPGSPSVTYSHHPLAAGHLPESYPSTPNSTSPASASVHANIGVQGNVAPAHSNKSHASPPSSMKRPIYPAALGNTAYNRASSGPAELRVPSTRINSSLLHAKLAHRATASSIQLPSSTMPPADKVSVQRDIYEHRHYRTMSADDNSGRVHSELDSCPSNERIHSNVHGDIPDKATTTVYAERYNPDSRPMLANHDPLDPSMSRKRKLDRTSMLFAGIGNMANCDDNEQGETSVTDEVELVGTISRADLLSFLREQSQQRQERESRRAEERRRSEDIRREEEWRFHEYQMSLMQLVQHSLVPFAVDDDGDLEQGEQIDATRVPLAVSPRNSNDEEEIIDGVSRSEARALPVAKPHVAEASANNPSSKAGNAEEVEMQSRTASPVVDDLNVSVSSPSSPPS
ncbi:hypothetical protein GGI24_000354 [Coemansia furcata]|nr:hypothetical protein GGI24_000354 [Coemansia furcata]